jgi:hypothetical protein
MPISNFSIIQLPLRFQLYLDLLYKSIDGAPPAKLHISSSAGLL